MNSRFRFLLIILSLTLLTSCQAQENTKDKFDFPVLTGPYLGQKPPDFTPEIFAPGIVSTENQHEFCCTFSPDGREFYFNRKMQIMVCKWRKTGWTKPVPVKFTEGYRAHEPHITADNKRLFFGSWRPSPDFPDEENPYGIWIAERTEESWSKPRYVGYGMYVTTTRDGVIYLTDIQEANQLGQCIARTKLVNGRFAELVRQKGGMVHPAPDRLPGCHPCVSLDESFIIFDSYDNDRKGRLYICYRNKDGTWCKAVDLGDEINFEDHICASLSPDGKYMFYHADSDIYWVKTDFIEKLKPNSIKKDAALLVTRTLMKKL